ncbi:MFS transporter [Allonocardiopsis opalescens]|uniref:MFS transporter n=1 Tax=Allonocardiopsis opalescens TaxID=1144618 RepID=UPI001474A09A|nr:MFS transporter [Allonocardiopsis opalescens]
MPERQATFRDAIAVREFRGLWAAQAFALVGDQLAGLAIAALVYQRTESALLTAFTYALTLLPPLIGGPLLSVLSDLFPRRRVMICCDLARACLVALMAVPHMPLPVLCALLFANMLLGIPYASSRAATLSIVLRGDTYVAGNALIGITNQAGSVAGLVVGGTVLGLIGTQVALAVNSVTFLGSALVILTLLRPRPAARTGGGRGPAFWLVLRDGARLVFGDRRLRLLMLYGWLCGFYVIPEGIALPYAAALGGGAATAGLLMASMPLGAVVGAVLITRLVRPADRLRLMPAMAVLACLPLVLSYFHPPLWLTFTLWAVSGLGSSYQIAANAAFVMSVPDAGRGLAFGLAVSGLHVVQGVGIIGAGALAQVLGAEPVVALGGLGGLIAAGLLASGWRRVRERPDLESGTLPP